VILYDYWRSSAAYRVRLGLAWKGLAWDSVPVDLLQGDQTAADYVARNPQGLVPLLVDGPAAISQSLAILEYLDETHPEPPLLPADPLARARVRSLALTIVADIHPVNNLRVLRYLKNELAVAQPVIDSWMRHWIAAVFAALEARAAATGGAFLAGDQLSLADLCLVPQLYNARRIDTDLGDFPLLAAIDRRISGMAFAGAAHPDAQPGRAQP